MDILKILKIILIAVVALYLFIFIITSVFQEKLLFVPRTLLEDFEYKFPTEFEEFYLTGTDGEAKLNALHFKVENPKGVILYFHGNAGHLADWGWVMQDYVQRGYDAIVMDYRSYGKSTGKIGEKELYSDAQLFYEYTEKHYDEKEIIVYGRSLGTTFATYVASKNKPSKLLLEAPFYNMKSLAQNMFPVFPVSWVLKYPFRTDRFIVEVTCPIYILHGTEDEIVPFESGRKLSELIPEKKMHFIPIKNGTHNNLVEEGEFIHAIDTIL